MIEELKDRFHNIIFQKKEKIKNEIELLEEKLEDTRSSYGVGGAYSRQEKAIDRREEILAELEELDIQIASTVKHKKVRVYQVECGNCHNLIMTDQMPFDGWHDCPICDGRFYTANLQHKEFKIVEEAN